MVGQNGFRTWKMTPRRHLNTIFERRSMLGFSKLIKSLLKFYELDPNEKQFHLLQSSVSVSFKLMNKMLAVEKKTEFCSKETCCTQYFELENFDIPPTDGRIYYSISSRLPTFCLFQVLHWDKRFAAYFSLLDKSPNLISFRSL